MSQVSKRWRLPRYLSLPLIVAVLLLVAAKLVALERAALIARLSEQVAHGDAPTSTAALRQLAAMPRPPVALLVEAATSPNAQIAREAQVALGAVLRRMQRGIAAGRQLERTAGQLEVLAESLALQRNGFADSDRAWLSKTTGRILRMGNRLPPQSTPLLASRCDTILASLRPAEVATSLSIGVEYESDAVAAVREVVTSTAPVRSELNAPGDERFAALSDRPFPAAASVAPSASEEILHDVLATTAAVDQSVGDTRPRPAFNAGESGWRPSWGHPMFFAVPAVPIESGGSELPRDDAPQAANPLRSVSPLPYELMSLGSRELLSRWLVAEGREVAALEEELTARGFERLTQPLVEQFFSENVEDRIALIDPAAAGLSEPALDSRPWLLLLADDESADVRLVAVTIMATSNDPELLEKAWQVAIHDRDPRIAALATPLRERRAAALSY